MMYGLLAAAAAFAFFMFVRSQRRQGAAEAIMKAAAAAADRMERSREIHAEIKRLPLSDRAGRLRQLDARR
jgi:type II secretory pathway pseudopilin PulG